jgi:hypothetical protein
MGLLHQLSGALSEGYMNPGSMEAYRAPHPYTDAVAALVAFVLAVLLVSLIGLWLWNYSVVPLFEFARPAKSVLQILGLVLFVTLIHP